MRLANEVQVLRNNIGRSITHEKIKVQDTTRRSVRYSRCRLKAYFQGITVQEEYTMGFAIVFQTQIERMTGRRLTLSEKSESSPVEFLFQWFGYLSKPIDNAGRR
uniref:Uncharacterized protein n=1 Tax=Cacopsylla melanoneura TaxID=428564 RepID=A0A8D8QK53_9HEMI